MHVVKLTTVVHNFVFREESPGQWNEKFDSFQKMIILKCLRPDKITHAMQDYVSDNMGQRFIEPQVWLYKIFILLRIKSRISLRFC